MTIGISELIQLLLSLQPKVECQPGDSANYRADCHQALASESQPVDLPRSGNSVRPCLSALAKDYCQRFKCLRFYVTRKV